MKRFTEVVYGPSFYPTGSIELIFALQAAVSECQAAFRRVGLEQFVEVYGGHLECKACLVQ